MRHPDDRAHRCLIAPTGLLGAVLGKALMGLVLLVLVVSQAQARTGCDDRPLTLSTSNQSYDLGRCLWYLEDPQRSLSLADVMASDGPTFNRHQGSVLNFGYTESAYWARIDLAAAPRGDPQTWILELALPLVDDLDLYLVRQGEVVEHRHAGYSRDWSQRELAVPNPTFRLQLPAGEPLRLYLRVATQNTLRLPLTLWQPDRYLEKVSVDEVFRGLLLGSILGILAYNLFVAVSVRERSNIYYVLYLVMAVMFIVTEQVHGTQLFGKRPWFFDKAYLHYQIMGTWFFGLLMARSLLETRWRSPELDKVIRVSLYCVLATLGLATVMPYHIAMEWCVLVTILLCVVMIVVSYLSWRHYNPAARAYFYAWTVALSGFVVYALTVMGYLPLNIVTAHASQIGLAGQIILFSFALADRIKLVQGEALSWSQRALANLRQYQSLFDNAVEGVFQMSLDRRFITANPAMAELLGFASSRELIKARQDVLAACFADDRVREWVVDQIQHHGSVKGIEARFQTRQGEDRWANISLHTVYDAEGDPRFLEGTCIDATERHQRQQIEKEREQERLDKELARNAAEAKSQFLANMSHEIRTPLAAIIGYGETLLEPDLNEAEKRNSAETVVRSGRHLLDLVNDILDHSKIDANKLAVDIVTVNLPELLDELRAFFESRAREKGLDFSIDCEFPLPQTIQTDPTRFRQILINLCGNALKFTERGSITLALACDWAEQRLHARVADTGIGMKPEQLQRLFDPFAQGSAAIARQYGGTGLGLSISRRLAELLGGAISVRSRYGDGSEFDVTIATGPLEDVVQLRDASELNQSRPLPLVQAPQLAGRILCAEDNEVNRKLVSLLVARTGAELVHVGNGAEALDVASQQHFDLILMDIQMPVMNGRDAMVALREAGINTPTLALTANVMSEDIDDYRRAGFTDHLAKPIDKQRFYDLLARYLDAAPPRPATSQRYRGLVLVAEDNDDNRKLVVTMLQRFGLEVIAVASGDDAVRTALAKPVQLVLMDRHMPGMDGVDACQLLRQAGFRRPLVAFSAGDAREIEALQGAGCEGVLTKPIDPERLAALLARYLPQATAGDAVEVADEDAGIEQLVRQFLASLAQRRQRMARARATQTAEPLRQEAHQIKGTAGAMGYPAMTELAGELERSLKMTPVDWQRVSDQLTALDALIEQALGSERTRDTGP